MSSVRQLHTWTASFADNFRSFARNERGATIVVVALVIPVVVGAMALAVEISYWHWRQRAMQNAADAAAIAAATNGGPTYDGEANAVTAQYGFRNGVGNITVSATNSATAPGCSSNCYSVQVSDKVPLFLSPVIGYKGNATAANGKRVELISSTAVATSGPAYPYCILALASSGAQGITSNGAPNADLNGCNTMSNTGSTCNGGNLNAAMGDAAGTNKGCGHIQNSNVPIVTDPYSGLASNIPANPCHTYPTEPIKPHDPPLSSSNKWSGSFSYGGGNHIVCGDQQLTGNTTINDAVLVIENGQLDTNGYTLSGSNLTIVFTGTNGASYQHFPSGGGTLDIQAPASGDWSGVAIYQDPSLTKNVDVSAAGNSPAWDISGLVYLPHSSVTLSGVVNKSANGALCFAMVVDNITINGTGSIYKNDNQCGSAGLTPPEGGHRGALVN